jgi:hypothetical protein
MYRQRLRYREGLVAHWQAPSRRSLRQGREAELSPLQGAQKGPDHL